MSREEFYQVMRLVIVVALVWASCSGVTVTALLGRVRHAGAGAMSGPVTVRVVAGKWKRRRGLSRSVDGSWHIHEPGAGFGLAQPTLGYRERRRRARRLRRARARARLTSAKDWLRRALEPRATEPSTEDIAKWGAAFEAAGRRKR